MVQGRAGQQLQVETWRLERKQRHRGVLLTRCFPHHGSLSLFSYNSELLAWARHHTQYQYIPLISIINQENTPTCLLTSQSCGGMFLIKSPSSQTYLGLCQADHSPPAHVTDAPRSGILNPEQSSGSCCSVMVVLWEDKSTQQASG